MNSNNECLCKKGERQRWNKILSTWFPIKSKVIYINIKREIFFVLICENDYC